MMCSSGQGESVYGWPGRWERGLLFDAAPFAFDFGAFAGTGGGQFTRLHELADVSAGH